MKKAAFPSKLSNTWKQCGGGYDRFVIPWEDVPMLVNPLEVLGWPLWPNLHPSGSGRSTPAAFLASMQPWPPGRVWVLPVPLDVSSASHHGPATHPQCLGNLCGKSRDEGGFYQSHHEEELILCLNSAKAVPALHQQELET